MSSKRKDGEGSIRTLPSGRIEIRFRVEDIDGSRVRKTVTGATLEEAQARRDDILRRVANGEPITDSRLDVATWAREWLNGALAESDRRTSTKDQYQTLVALHAVPVIGKKALADIGARDIRRVLNEAKTRRTGQPLADSSKRSLYAALRAMFDDAVTEHLLAVNPVASVKRPTTPRATKRALDPAAVDQLLADTADDRLHIIIVLACMAGLSRSEALGLLWSDIHWRDHELEVSGALVRNSDGLHRGPPKAESRYRRIPMTPYLEQTLKQVRAEQEDLALERPDRTFNPGHYVVVSVDGYPMDPRTVSRWYSKYAAKANLDDLGLHAQRHSAATQWLGSNLVSTVDAAELLGHSDTKMVTQVYAKAVKENQRAAVIAAADRFRSA